jgi:hypothetical protein
MKKLTTSEFGIWLFKRQVEDDTLSQAMSHCSLNGNPTDIELKKISQPVEQISGSSQRSNQYMNQFYSSVFLSVMQKFSNALVTFPKQICFGCGEKGHYVNKCPQRRPKHQPTETGIATPQSIHHSKNFQTLVVRIRRCKDHKLLRISNKPHQIRSTTIMGRGSLFQQMPQSMYTSPFYIDHEYNFNLQ